MGKGGSGAKGAETLPVLLRRVLRCGAPRRLARRRESFDNMGPLAQVRQNGWVTWYL